MTERLWAGWRMTYIREAAGVEAGGGAPECLFCGLGGLPAGPSSLVVEKYGRCFTVLNAFPYTCGHLMVAPYAHTDLLNGGGDDVAAEMLAAVDRARRALVAEYAPQGFNVGVNLGRAAGAGVLGHLHWHLVPRWNGDTNFMPALAEVRVLPESLPETCARIARAFRSLSPDGLVVRERA